MASFDAIADLPLEIESCEFEGLEITLGEFERLTTIVKLRGGGEEGIGEDVVYDSVDHIAQQGHGPPAGLAFSGTFAGFSAHLDPIDLFPAAPPVREDPSRDYRRWAFESAALDLALRQAGTNLAAALGREPRPLNFVNSMRLAGMESDERSSIEPLLARLAVYPTLRFKLDPANDWDDELIAALAETGAVDSLDLKGFYKGTPVDVDTDPELYAKLIAAFPDAWLEDPDVTEETRPLLEPGLRAGHLGRADPLDRRHRGDAVVAAADGQRQALALRPDPQPLRRLRLLRAARDRRLRRRPDRARPGPRPDPVPGLDLPSRHPQRRGAGRLQRPRAGDQSGSPLQPPGPRDRADRIPLAHLRAPSRSLRPAELGLSATLDAPAPPRRKGARDA